MPRRPVITEPGSFRDPDSRVFRSDGRILRALSPEGLEDFEALTASKLYAQAQEDGRLVRTERLEAAAIPAGLLTSEPAAVLRHELIPFVSYPYEWSFSMLQDAALLQLDLLLAALEEHLILKDSSSFNVQFRGTRPLFIDVGSFERLRAGEPWVGYRQFCMLFLYPLLIQAYGGVDFHPLLRGAIDGITPEQASAMLQGGAGRHKGVLTHVRMHARLERRNADRKGDVSGELKDAGFKPELIKANVQGLRKLVSRLEWKPGLTQFADYTETKTYTDAETVAKQSFVRDAVAQARPALVWDLGCNDGLYSRAALEAGAGYVVALDSEHELTDRLYRTLRSEEGERILPLTMNLADPSPGLGWRGRERTRLEDRGRPGVVLALALLHHLVISANIPVAEVLDWFAALDCALVVEFVDRDDEMSRTLLARKRPNANPDYRTDTFERLLAERFAVARTEQVTATRRLYHALPKG